MQAPLGGGPSGLPEVLALSRLQQQDTTKLTNCNQGVVVIVKDECCSDIKVAIDRTEALDKRQDKHEGEQKVAFADVWSTINGIRNRLPVWATFTFSFLTFLLGVLVTVVTFAFKGGN